MTDTAQEVIDLAAYGLGRGRGGPVTPALIDPRPGVEGRWQPTRCGVVDSWNWGAEQFIYHNGSCAFVGPNGTGKSLNACIFVPTLTDANITEKALSASGQSGARLVSLHLGNQTRGPKEGVWWHEYGFIEPGSSHATYFTIGLWLNKPASDRDRLERAWFVVENTRVDDDLHLVEHGHAVGIARLAEQLQASGGRLFTSSDPLVKKARGKITVIEPEDGYPAAVRLKMYNPFTADQITALTGVQRTLRGVRVGDDKLPHDFLANILTQALPGLAEGPVRELADVLTRTGSLEQRLTQARSERNLLSDVAAAYQAYAAAQAAALAARLIDRDSGYRTAQSRKTGIESEIARLHATHEHEAAQFEEQRTRLGLLGAEIRTVKDSLAEHPGAQIDHLADVAQGAESVAVQFEQRAQADLERANTEREQLEAALAELDRSREALSSTLEAARSSAAKVGAQAHHAPLEALIAPLLADSTEALADLAAQTKDLDATRRIWTDERTRDLSRLAVAITRFDTTGAEHEQAAEKLDGLERESAEKFAEAERRRRAFDVAHAEIISTLENYIDDLAQLHAPDSAMLAVQPLDLQAWHGWAQSALSAAVARIDVEGARGKSEAAAAAASQAGLRLSEARDAASHALGELLARTQHLGELAERLPRVLEPVAELRRIVADVGRHQGACDPDALARVEVLRESCAQAAATLAEQIDAARDSVVRAAEARTQATAQAERAEKVARDAQSRIELARGTHERARALASSAAQAAIAQAQQAAAIRKDAAAQAETEAVAEADARAEAVIARAVKAAQDAQQQADEAQAAANKQEAAWLEEVHSWFERLRILPSAALPKPPRQSRDGFDPALLTAAVTSEHLASRLSLGDQRNGAQNQLDELDARESLLHEQIRQAQHTESRPHTPPWKPEHTGLPGASLWELVDFAGHVDAATRDHIEGALLAAGLLDARITEDGAIEAGETYLRPHPVGPGATTLSSYLVPEPSSRVTEATVLALLNSVQVTLKSNGVIDGLVLTENSGELRTGLIQASAPRGWQARYIGATARARARQALLENLNHQLQQLQGPLAAARERIIEIDSSIATAGVEADSLPPYKAMLTAADRSNETRETARRVAADTERRTQEASAQREQDLAAAHTGCTREIADAERECAQSIEHAENTRTQATNAAEQALENVITTANGDETAARDEAAAAHRNALTLRSHAEDACRAVGVEADLNAITPVKIACAEVSRAADATASILARSASTRGEADRHAKDAEEARAERSAALARYLEAQQADAQAAAEYDAFPSEELDGYGDLRRAAEYAAQAAEQAQDAVSVQRRETHTRLTQLKEAESQRNAAASVGGSQPTLVTTTDQVAELHTAIASFNTRSDAATNAAATTSLALTRTVERHRAARTAERLATESASHATRHRRTANEKQHAFQTQKDLHDVGFQELNDRLAELEQQSTDTDAAVERHRAAQSDAREAIAARNETLASAAEQSQRAAQQYSEAVGIFHGLFERELIADLAGGSDIPRPETDHQALETAQRVIAERGLPARIDPARAEALAVTARTTMERAIREARELLMGLGRTVDADEVEGFPWHQVILSVLGTAGAATGAYPTRQPLPIALGELEGRIAKLEDDFTEQLQTKFKEYITGDLRKHINERILLAGDIVTDIKDNLETLRTGVSRVGVRLKWTAREDPLSKRAIDLIRGANSEGNFQELFDFFMGQLQQDGTIRDAEGRIEEVFDYRNWYEWTVEITHEDYSEDGPDGPEIFKQITKRRNPLNELSAGEKRLVTMLPLLAALRAFYSADGYRGPRTVFIDELDAAFDVPNRRKVLELLRSWDMDVLATLPSQAPLLSRETGAIAINKLTKTSSGLRVSTPSIWDGRSPVPSNVQISLGTSEGA